MLTTIREGLQDRANALINSGTSVGVALSGPAALLVTEQWRIAWFAFALVGCGCRVECDVPWLSVRYLVGPRSVPLFAAATGVGFASAGDGLGGRTNFGPGSKRGDLGPYSPLYSPYYVEEVFSEVHIQDVEDFNLVSHANGPGVRCMVRTRRVTNAHIHDLAA
jgi:hypothetical protein